MSKQNKKSKGSVTFGPFSGIDARTPHTGISSAADVVNFRPGKDGSLIKRCGYHYLFPLSAPIRAAWTGKLFGTTYIILAEGSYVERINPKTNARLTIGVLPGSVKTKLQFCYYRDRLYLFSECGIYEVGEKSITPVEGYVPLIGKNWTSTYVGEVFEPRNLLTRRARIEYVIEEYASVFLRTKWSVESIQAIYQNDTLVDSEKYFYDDNSQTIILQDMKEGDQIRVYLTYAEDTEPETAAQLRSCGHIDVFGDSANNRLFCWDGNQKNLFFVSTHVSAESLTASKHCSSSSVPLYFPEHCQCVLGDGRYDITGFVRQFNHLLIFTEGDTWTLDTEALSQPNFSAKPMHPLLGCATVGAYAMAENAPITVGLTDVYQWDTNTEEYNECAARIISDPIRSLPEKSFFPSARIFHYRTMGEVWFYAPDVSESIWIYRIADGLWYRFSGFSPDIFFEVEDRLYFGSGANLYVFDDDFCEDTDSKNIAHPILATYTSGIFDYNTPHEKHFSDLYLSADCNGGTIRVSLLGDGLGEITCDFSDTDKHTVAHCRLSSGRFRYASLQIVADGTSRQVIHSLVSEVR